MKNYPRFSSLIASYLMLTAIFFTGDVIICYLLACFIVMWWAYATLDSPLSGIRFTVGLLAWLSFQGILGGALNRMMILVLRQLIKSSLQI